MLRESPTEMTTGFVRRATVGCLFLCACGVVVWRYVSDLPPEVSIPTQKMPQPNAFDDYQSAGNALIDNIRITNAEEPGQAVYSVKEKELLLTRNAGALRLLRQGFRYSYRHPPISSFSTRLRHLAKYRQLARLLLFDSEMREARGDFAAAMDSCLDSIRLAEDCQHGSGLIQRLVGVACQRTVTGQAWRLVNRLSADEALSRLGRLETIKGTRVSFSECLREEMQNTRAGIIEIMRDRNWRKIGEEVWQPESRGQRFVVALRMFFCTKRNTVEHYTDYMESAMAFFNKPFPTRTQSHSPDVRDQVAAFFIPALWNVWLADAGAHLQNDFLLVALALRCYRLAHGRYPQKLNQLAPLYLTSIPRDPFDLDAPIRYRRRPANSFILYSIGPDQEDDGGRVLVNRTNASHDTRTDRSGDIVAGVNFPASLRDRVGP